ARYYRESLQGRPEGLTAAVLQIDADLAAGQTDLARRELTTARQTYGDDPRLLWAEVRLAQSQPGGVKRAEGLLRGAATQHDEARLALALWLQRQGRFDEADQALAGLSADERPERKAALQFLQTQRQLEAVRERAPRPMAGQDDQALFLKALATDRQT